MSFNLILWKGPVVDDPEAAEALLEPFYEHGDDGGFEASGALARCAGELRVRFPDLLSPVPPDGDGPCAERPAHRSDRLLFLNLRDEAGSDVIEAIVELAHLHDLILYDPREREIILPDGLEEPHPWPPGPADYVRFALFGCGSVGMLWLGQRLSVPVLGPVLTAFGGFLTAVFVLILLLLIFKGRPR